jgi:hypothetical protein
MNHRALRVEKYFTLELILDLVKSNLILLIKKLKITEVSYIFTTNKNLVYCLDIFFYEGRIIKVFLSFYTIKKKIKKEIKAKNFFLFNFEFLNQFKNVLGLKGWFIKLLIMFIK